MQQEWDNLDEIIRDSFQELDVSKNYNRTLMNKLNGETKKRQWSYNETTALSFIFSGFLMMFIFTSSFQYTLIDLEYRLKTNILALQYNEQIGTIKDIFRSDLIGKKK